MAEIIQNTTNIQKQEEDFSPQMSEIVEDNQIRIRASLMTDIQADLKSVGAQAKVDAEIKAPTNLIFSLIIPLVKRMKVLLGRC